MEEKMSRWGIGPVFFSLSLGYGLIMIALSRHFHPAFEINVLPHFFMTILGMLLIAAGVPFWIISVKSVMRAYNSDKLVTVRSLQYTQFALIPGYLLIQLPRGQIWH